MPRKTPLAADRRRHPRAEVKLPVRFRDPQSSRVLASGHSVNISAEGILAQCMGTCELSEGSIVAVSLGGVQQSGSDEAVSFSGRVVRVGGQQRNLVAVEVLGQQPPFLRAPELVGRHPSILAVKDELLKIAHYDINVLIQGETGTGKNVVAEAIHRHSRRADAPFVRVNCPSIPPGLVESELFGHEKGAFTDARTARPGLFRLASRGTLLLDEVSVVPPAVQAKLLQAIEQKAFMPVGGSELVEVGTRIIATTNENLQTRMEQGLFREDLFHRLNEAPIRLPALRDRQSDIALLAEYFLHKYAAEFGKPYQPPDQGTMEMLLVYPWPGNVRELSNCLRYGVVTGTFRPPVEMARAETKGAGASLAGAEDRDAPVAPLREAREHAVAEAERAAIINALKACRYNKSRAASRLGVSYRTLLRKISRYHIAD